MTTKEQVKQLVDQHKIKLAQLQEGFQANCKSINDATKAKIAATPKENGSEFQKIMDDHQTLLNDELSKLNAIINKMDMDLLHSIEELQKTDEESKMANLLTLMDHL